MKTYSNIVSQQVVRGLIHAGLEFWLMPYCIFYDSQRGVTLPPPL